MTQGDATANESFDHPSKPFAIVGISFRGPQEAIGEDGLLDVLQARKNLMTEWPKERTTVDSFYDGSSKRPNKVCYLYICSTLLTPHKTILEYTHLGRFRFTNFDNSYLAAEPISSKKTLPSLTPPSSPFHLKRLQP